MAGKDGINCFLHLAASFPDRTDVSLPRFPVVLCGAKYVQNTKSCAVFVGRHYIGDQCVATLANATTVVEESGLLS